MGRVASRKPPAATPTGVDWSKCASAVRDYDASIVEAWRRDMDNSITFAALFSVVVATFLSQSYKWPQDPAFDRTAAKVINAGFFSSLIISLNAVLTAILVKQWLAEYTWALESRSGSSQEILALRQVRFDGLNKWKLPQIIDYLPLSIIFAVYLFLAGLAYLAWTLDLVVGIISIILVSASALFFVVTSVLPTFYPDSCARSPQAWLVHHARTALTNAPGKEVSDWSQILMEHVKATELHPEVDALYWIQSVLTSWNPALLPSVWSCAVSLSSPSLAANAICTLYRHTASHTVGDNNLFTAKHAAAFCKDVPRGDSLLASGHKALIKAFPSRARPAAFTTHAMVDYALFVVSTMEKYPDDEASGTELFEALLCVFGLFDPQISPLGHLTPSERRALDARLVGLLEKAFEKSGTMWVDSLEDDNGGVGLLLQTTLSAASAHNSAVFPFLSAYSVLLYAAWTPASHSAETIARLLKDMRSSLVAPSGNLDLALGDATEQKVRLWAKMLVTHARSSGEPFEADGPLRTEMHALLKEMDRALAFEGYTSDTKKHLFAMVMAWGTPEMITKITVSKVEALLASAESFNEVAGRYWAFNVHSDADAAVNDILLDATAGEGTPTTHAQDCLLIAQSFMLKEQYKSASSLPNAIASLRHITKRMHDTEDARVLEAFLLALRSFTQKEYALPSDSARGTGYNVIKVPDSLRGQLLACVEELYLLAQHLSSNALLSMHVLELSALVSRAHHIPARLASTCVPSSEERTVYLQALDRAVQEYTAAGMDAGEQVEFRRVVLGVFDEIEKENLEMTQRRILARARAYVQ
ncbi:hypothetical protein FB45DRAFT_902138 [Roridomyces roridus]|uniref:DUF6535 domain-containing protein n=1 Tax=Roridomyces roridus TaxID=1738132 RepID=A0AAD7FTP4_9AGAR|nr:hypothetical protein FB45DRAFT_902138 [Roridomyces roridus]